MSGEVDYTSLFQRHRTRLWGLAYRMTGSTAEADDLVQETFARALKRPPPDLDRPWEPWLVTITVRLAIDALRRRQTQAYVGEWLPALLTPSQWTEQETTARTDGELGAQTLQTLSYAYTLALESLSANARAVLILRDAFGFTGPETAEMLSISPENVRTTLTRARRTMQEHRLSDHAAAPLRSDQAQRLLTQFLAAVASRDADALLACLAEDVRLVADGGGRYASPLKPLHGVDTVSRFFFGITKNAEVLALDIVSLHGEPAVLGAFRSHVTKAPPKSVFRIEPSSTGDRIAEIHLVSAPEKIAGLPFGGPD